MRKLVAIIGTISGIFFSTYAPLADDSEQCDCASFAIYDQVVPLAKQVGVVGMIALLDDRPSYYPTNEHRETLALTGWEKKNIPEKCRKKSPTSLRMRISPPSEKQTDLGLWHGTDYFESLMQDLNGIRLLALSCEPPALPPPLPRDKIEAKALTVDETLKPPYCVSSDMNENIQKILDMGLNGEFDTHSFSGIDTKRTDFQVLNAYFQFIHSGSEAGAENVIRGLSSELTQDQKMIVLQAIGYRAALDYDRVRADKVMLAEGVVSMDDLLKNWANNTDKGYNFDPANTAYKVLGLPEDWAVAGVCRDAAVAQAKVATWFGMRAYTVSYAVDRNFHTSVVIIDKDSPTRLHKINWSELSDTANLEGGQALYQGMPDGTLSYRISDENGKMLNVVPSELGKVLQEMAGFRPQTLDPLVSSRSNVLSTELPSGPNKDYRLFFAEDPTGANYYSGAYTRRHREGTNTPGQIGFVIGTQSKRVGPGRNPFDKSLDFIYAQIEQHLDSPKKSILNGHLQVQIESLATAMMMVGATRHGTSYETSGAMPLTIDGDLRAQAGLTVRQGRPKNGVDPRVSTVWKAYLQVAPGVSDIRNMYAADLPTNARLVLTHALFSAEGRVKLSQTPEGRAYLVAATQVLASQTGLRGRAEVGVALQDVAALLDVQGRLTKDTPALEEGTIRRAGGKLIYRPRQSIDVGLSWYYNLEEDAALGTDFNVMGNVTIRR